MQFIKLLALIPIISLAAASGGYHKYNEGEYIGMSCKSALTSTAIFCKKDTTKSYACQCSNIDAMGSFVYCGYQESKTPEEREQFEEFFIEQCPKVTAKKIASVYTNVTSYLTNVKDIPKFNKSKPISVPIYYKKALYNNTIASVKARYRNFDDAMGFGAGLMAYWALIFLFGIIHNLMSKLAPTLLLNITKKTSSWAPVRYYRKFISIPATFRSQHVERNVFRGLVPTRLESLVVFGFFVLVVVFEATRYHYVENDTIWPKKDVQMARYVGDRTAVISLFLSVLTFLLAGRNNIMLWLTGWKQSTFITYHKWIARITVLSSAAHGIAMFADSVWMGKYGTRKLTDWYRWGCVAMVAATILFLQAVSFLRVWNYEVFLYIHIAMAVIFLVGVWRHCEDFSYDQWAFACAAIWVFDRAVRIGRIISFGTRDATVTIVSNETLQVTVPKRKWWKSFPGAYGYVYFLKSAVFWQSHPFTIVEEAADHVKFYIKIKKGATEHIYKKLLNEPNYSGSVKITVEGPYGDHKPVSSYDQVLLYTGGNGIPGPYTYAKEILEAKERSKVQFTKLYWVIRHWHSLDWFLQELKTLEKYEKLQVVVYVTKYEDAKLGEKFLNETSTSNSSQDGEKNMELDDGDASDSWIEPVQRALPFVEFRQGRPDIKQLVTQDLQEAQGSNVAVMTCAHPHMCDEVRNVVASQVGEHNGGRIELFEEFQTW